MSTMTTKITTTTPDDLQGAAPDRPRLLKLMQCRLWHRADWRYLETRASTGPIPWPVDAYHCQRCERSWETAC
jgi:hypothetical protein